MASPLPHVIAETPRWLVLDKPAGWLTIPGRGDASIPVLAQWATKEFGRVWIVHRLDLETSGVILLARSAEDHRSANSWFLKHEVKKLYHCLAQGLPTSPLFRLNLPIEGARSVTQVEVKERFEVDGGGFLAHARPQTGRRHQIRIHLSQAGFPLWGDSRYGGAARILRGARAFEVSRVALHAARLELPGGEGVFEAPWPEDFKTWVSEARGE